MPAFLVIPGLFLVSLATTVTVNAELARTVNTFLNLATIGWLVTAQRSYLKVIRQEIGNARREVQVAKQEIKEEVGNNGNS